MLYLNFNKLALFLFASAFTSLHIVALESQQEPVVLASNKTGTHKPTRISDSDGFNEVTGEVSESCSVWEKFLMYIYCMEVTGLGTSMAAGRPPVFTQSAYVDQREINACRSCLLSFKDCCESKIQAYKKSNS